MTEQVLYKGKPILTGRQITPLKILIHGDNGVGKSTFASQSKAPIFLDIEKNVDLIDVPKQPLDSWTEVTEFLDWLKQADHPYKTAVLDGLERLETFAKEEVNSTHSKDDLAYGRDTLFRAELFEQLVTKLEDLRRFKKMNIILIGHSVSKTANDPDEPLHDKKLLEMSDKCASPLRHWCHCILYAKKKYLSEKEKKGWEKRTRFKSVEKHVALTNAGSCVSKEGWDLPPEIELKWDVFARHIAHFFNTSKNIQENTENA